MRREFTKRMPCIYTELAFLSSVRHCLMSSTVGVTSCFSGRDTFSHLLTIVGQARLQGSRKPLHTFVLPDFKQSIEARVTPILLAQCLTLSKVMLAPF